MLQVFVQVEDDNDNAPLSEQPSYIGHVIENSLSGTSVLRLTAHDADQPPHNLGYSLTAGNSAGHFAVDPSGTVTNPTQPVTFLLLSLLYRKQPC